MKARGKGTKVNGPSTLEFFLNDKKTEGAPGGPLFRKINMTFLQFFGIHPAGRD
jgi:hypothetical protein